MAGFATPISQALGGTYGKITTGVITVTTAGTAVRFTATSTMIGGVWVAADMNSGVMSVGDSSTLAANGSQRGIIVVPGNKSMFIPVNDLSLLWADAQTNGATLSITYVQPIVGSFSS